MKEGYKECAGKYGCGEVKLVCEFHFSNKGKNQYQVQCKDCRNEIRRFKTEEKKEKYRADVGIVDGTDRCYVCKEIKQIGEFKTRSNVKIGYERVCKDCHNGKNRKMYFVDLDRSRSRGRAHNAKSRSNPVNRKKANENSRRFFIDNPDYRRNYEMGRRKSDPEFKLRKNLRRRINSAIKNGQKAGSAVRDLGISVNDLKLWLEIQFYRNTKTGEAMTWENYGRTGWHIDHIVPLAKFDLTDREQLLESCHFTNLQPLWAEDNYKKGSK